MAQVVVLGDACVDMTIRLPNRAAGKLDLTQSTPQLRGGGTGANTAVALARLGQEVTMISAVGDDGYGRWIMKDLADEKIDASGVHLLYDSFTPMVMALIEPDGERLVVVWPPEGGAQNEIQPEFVTPVLLSGKNWLHTTGMCLRASPSREAVLYGMEQARAAGLTVSIDLNMRLELWDLSPQTKDTFMRAVELADVVFGNAEEEIIPLSGETSLESAAQKLGGGQRVIAARMGAEGVWISTPAADTRSAAFQVEIVDTLGAGDSFNSGFIAACLAGHDVKEAGRWGNAAAAIKLTRAGARGAPTRSELTEFLANAGVL
jgi:sugar/nucleoside kinase (ribokinase family)